MKRFVTLFLLTLSFFQDSAVAQSMQRNSTLLNRQLFLPARFYGSGVSFYDVNQDGFDDITIPMVGDSVLCFVSDGAEFHDRSIAPCLGEGKMTVWGDYDNDGDPDLFLTVLNDACKLFRNDGDWNFIDVTNEIGLQNAANQEFFGASWGDYNGDGWLDIFIATYEAGLSKENMLFKNNGGVSFTDVSDVMGVGVDSDYSFQGTFMDFDFDGDQDLHVANDRPPIDAYYINETDYISNQALATGLDIYSNSMSSSFADYDHDGFWPNLSSGNYLINASDWNSCSTTINISIDEPAELFGELQIDPNNAPNVLVTASGGVPPYQIIGEGEGFDQTQSFNVVAGNYLWILQDANGCQVELEFNMPTSVGEISNLPFQWRMEENEFRILNDQALKMTIYSLDGKLINEVNNASFIALPKVDGVFILRIDEGFGRDWTIKLPIIR